MPEATEVGRGIVARPPESPVTGTSYVGPGVSGQGFGKGNAGVYGSSLPPPPVSLGAGVVGVGETTALTPAADQIGDGVYGEGLNGVHGATTYNAGVLGEHSGGGPGVSGASAGGDGVYGESKTGFGLHGRNLQTPNLPSIGAPAPPPSTTPPPSIATSVHANGCGVFGESYLEAGVFGASAFQYGVHGVAGELSGIAPPANTLIGVRADSKGGYGVYATSTAHAAIYGETSVVAESGVHGVNTGAFPCVAILGSSDKGHGAKGVNGAGSGKSPKDGAGVWGDSDQGYGVYGATKSGKAGVFDGDVDVTGDVSVSGNVTAKDVILSGADCAEEFDVTANAEIEPGCVVVFDDDAALALSDRPYDRRVAGVISGAGAFRPGVVLDRRETDRRRAPIALVGKVYCRVDAAYGAIAVGDLLTSSPTPGHAMRASDPGRAFGAVIGKALGGHGSGLGLIPILVTLR